MQTEFHKYHGAGNDFIIIDDRENLFDKKNQAFIQKLCSRRFGIGADGLILLENDSESDFRMVYFNADGNESSMCGNGGRCIVAFAKKLDIISGKTKFIAIDGLHYAEIDDNNYVKLQMKDVETINNIDGDFVSDTGSPHYVKIVKEHTTNFVEEAKTIRNSQEYQAKGINVNFITINDRFIDIRTFERGVENETLACGTGCVAAALSVMELQNNTNKVLLKTKGGNIEVTATKTDKGYQNVYLYGPTEFVFAGVL